MECVKALVAAGADISIKNDAGLDAVFLAERTAWTAEAENENETEGAGDDGTNTTTQQQQKEGEEKGEGVGKSSPGREVVEWLLGCERGGSLETAAGDENGSGSSGEAMDGVEKTS